MQAYEPVSRFVVKESVLAGKSGGGLATGEFVGGALSRVSVGAVIHGERVVDTRLTGVVASVAIAATSGHLCGL
jgi:hypothetical protein